MAHIIDILSAEMPHGEHGVEITIQCDCGEIVTSASNHQIVGSDLLACEICKRKYKITLEEVLESEEE